MKPLLPLLLLLCSTAFAQKLITDKTDEFTGKKVKETSIENLAQPFKMSGYAYKFSFKKINDALFFNLRAMSLSNSVFAIKDGEVLMLKMADTVVKLSNIDYVISKRGGAGGSGLSSANSQGVSLYFPLNKESAELIKSNTILKVRLYTTEGYTEQDVKTAADKRVKDALTLVL
jgi:hypothetical protein